MTFRSSHRNAVRLKFGAVHLRKKPEHRPASRFISASRVWLSWRSTTSDRIGLEPLDQRNCSVLSPLPYWKRLTRN